MGSYFRSNKKQKEEKRRKKQEEKRNKRLHKKEANPATDSILLNDPINPAADIPPQTEVL